MKISNITLIVEFSKKYPTCFIHLLGVYYSMYTYMLCLLYNYLCCYLLKSWCKLFVVQSHIACIPAINVYIPCMTTKDGRSIYLSMIKSHVCKSRDNSKYCKHICQSKEFRYSSKCLLELSNITQGSCDCWILVKVKSFRWLLGWHSNGNFACLS